MTQLLGSIFEELGLAQYLDAFIEQGFDTWETILDVTESDLYVGFDLGVGRANSCEIHGASLLTQRSDR